MTKLQEWKAVVAAFFGTLGTLLGWKGVLLVVWVFAMVLDYVSGTCAAAKNSQWSSSVARQGLWHKGGMIIVVVVALIADILFTYLLPQIPVINLKNPGFLLPLVLAWYIITEVGSVIENAVKMGAAVPKWLKMILDGGLHAVDKAGKQVAESVGSAAGDEGTENGPPRASAPTSTPEVRSEDGGKDDE